MNKFPETSELPKLTQGKNFLNLSINITRDWIKNQKPFNTESTEPDGVIIISTKHFKMN